MTLESSHRERIRVLFLCVHNSGRSQMAEGLLRDFAPDAVEVESAGFEPRPVLPEAIAAMRQLGIDISAAQPKAVFDLYREGRIYDFIVTVCDEASAEKCPIFPGFAKRVHWSFPDPSDASGSPTEKLAEVVRIRDLIRSQLNQWIDETPLLKERLKKP